MALRSGAGREAGGERSGFLNCFEPVVEGIQTNQMTYTHTYVQIHATVSVGEQRSKTGGEAENVDRARALCCCL